MNDYAKTTLRQVEMKYRLEELKRRTSEEESSRLLIRLITTDYDNYIGRIKMENKDKDDFQRLKDACVQDVRDRLQIAANFKTPFF